MRSTWRLLTDDEGERRMFADLAATLRMPSRAAGPKNRLRHVLRIDADADAFFLKTFTRTQCKNRIWYRVSSPRADDDAEREWRVTQALRSAGFEAPRPVACGRRGAASYYLCARLPGRSCHDLVATGDADARLWRLAADHCGRLLAAGFRLPDLSADHVFARGDQGEWRLGVLDLHNGSLGAPGPVGRRLAVRVLRRFARSARDLPVAWPQALRFAARLLRAADRRGGPARAVLDRLPPFATARRYETAGKSAAYAERNPRRSARELHLLQSVWPGRPGETVLDVPCGAGRLLPLLVDACGHRVVHADGAFAMLVEARRRLGRPVPAVQADALAMPFATGAVDGVVMFRFLHHLPTEARTAAIAEVCRLARRFVVVSFFHPCSFHHLARRLRQLAGRSPTRFPVPLQRLCAEFAAHGFRLEGKAADLPFARDLWLASFVRRDAVAGEGEP